MKTKHTPGPWIIDDSMAKDERSSVLWYCIKDDEGHNLAEVKGIHCHIPNSAAKANAKIIAEAPEMLELIELVYKSFGGGHIITFSENDIIRFEQVFKKATE